MCPSLPRQTLSRRKLVQQLLSNRQTPEGFTLVELLIVVVILGVLGAVGIPAYFNQVNIARENAANQAVMATAKACTAARVTNDTANFNLELPDGVTGTCDQTGVSTFTSSIPDLTTQATAAVSEQGVVTLTQPAVSP